MYKIGKISVNYMGNYVTIAQLSLMSLNLLQINQLNNKLYLCAITKHLKKNFSNLLFLKIISLLSSLNIFF